MGPEVFRQIGSPHRPIFDLEAAALAHLVGRHARSRQLRQDQGAVFDDIL